MAPALARTVPNEPTRARSFLAPRRLDPMRTTFGRDNPPIPLHRNQGHWHGVVVHTTGGGIRPGALKRGWTPSQEALWCYAQEWAGHPHYLIDDQGVVWQITDESLCAVHCGSQAWMRDLMLSGEWVHHVSESGLAHWLKRWPGVKSPQHLFPGAHANDVYLGIEMIPEPDSTFNGAQYGALHSLLADLATRHNFPLTGSHLVGHEDLIPFDTADSGRWDKRGGWDPGFLRDAPRFDWARAVSA